MRAIVLLVGLLLLLPVGTQANDKGFANFSKHEMTLAHKINMARFKAGLRPARFTENLNIVAAKRSYDMQRFGYFAHSNPWNGRGAWEVAKDMGLRIKNGGYENIIMLKDCDSSIRPKRIPGIFKRGWMHSPPHRKQMLKRNIDRMGISIIRKDVGGCSRWIGTLVMTRK